MIQLSLTERHWGYPSDSGSDHGLANSYGPTILALFASHYNPGSI